MLFSTQLAVELILKVFIQLLPYIFGTIVLVFIVDFFIHRARYGGKKTNKHGHRCYIEGLSEAERKVVDVLAHGLSCKDYFIFNNLILPKNGDSSTQIDHLVVSRFGIFVIESKDYQGWIFGSAEHERWTQSLPGANKFSFYNPLRQNQGHITVLKSLMPFIAEDFRSIVVFSNRCEFKTPRIENVLYLSELVEYIKSYQAPRISEEHLLMVIGKLSYLCQAVDITADEHIANVERVKELNTHK